MMSRDFMNGVSIQPNEQLNRMKDAGVEWLRIGVPFPFEGKVGRVSPQFRTFAEQARDWHQMGFKVMGVSPCPRDFMNVGGVGVPGGPLFLNAYEEGCRFMAQELVDMVPAWQIANELNLEVFSMPLTTEDAITYARRGGIGLRRGNPSAFIGVNMAGFWGSGLSMYEILYSGQDVELDYAGVDLYFGSFEPGGPEDFRETLRILNEKTGKPIIVQECGYGSTGETMNEEEQEENRKLVEGGRWQDWFDYPHQARKWGYCWRDRTPETQAAYLEQTYEILLGMPDVIGAFWCTWADTEWCFYCGEPGCTWTELGLVDVKGEPKPAYHALARIAGTLRRA
ncbi:MAG: hypothetical protein HY709_08020 [Candidatus Latescibacteria bacterium]|nr:hypothetical protein [Candidatus Latescibacterota bacterium]